MPYPRLDDDGQTVTLDLHGAPVEEALSLARRVVTEAARRGRRNVRLIHGRSAREGRRTIREGLYDALDRGALPEAVSHWRGEGFLLLALDAAPAASDPAPLRLRDVT